MPCRPKFNATHAWAASSKHNAKYKKYISQHDEPTCVITECGNQRFLDPFWNNSSLITNC